MSGSERRAQVLSIAAGEFGEHGLHGASVEAIAHEAGITQAYVFRMFGTKKALFLELVGAAFDRFSEGMAEAAADTSGREALTRMGARYYESLADRTTLKLQLQGFAACGDDEVRELVRARVARMWDTVADTTGLDAVTVKSFLAFGALLNGAAALGADEVAAPWAEGVRTRIRPGLFEHITADTNR
ncbi:TetR/AcrR family transcriptional regulator [Amycolatopsis sp. FDAARGOS 1241]|uniref:TetR/AcrR family transcriptional regulator n=1 Tax=Amycolatopsis sp. FDAARGOS 1241 TaxID=2778070 RepID=UPI00194FE081|nr:TetR/AcrR family transcriptional regulator [Amycolatopsis sp. FDAARGOS 1241]QRP51139.1 TetR/AcrR family transcriptional regulator [Amycolatopsis sp. FDAARGOS 1241]